MNVTYAHNGMQRMPTIYGTLVSQAAAAQPDSSLNGLSPVECSLAYDRIKGVETFQGDR